MWVHTVSVSEVSTAKVSLSALKLGPKANDLERAMYVLIFLASSSTPEESMAFRISFQSFLLQLHSLVPQQLANLSGATRLLAP